MAFTTNILIINFFLVRSFLVPFADTIPAELSPESLQLGDSFENLYFIHNTAFANCAN